MLSGSITELNVLEVFSLLYDEGFCGIMDYDDRVFCLTIIQDDEGYAIISLIQYSTFSNPIPI